MSGRPVIGITGPVEGGGAAWLFTRLAVTLAGGRPRRITVASPAAVAELDGLVLGGGSDVDPARYRAERIEPVPEEGGDGPRGLAGWLELALSVLLFPLFYAARKLLASRAAPLDRERDALELGLLAGAVERGLPVLGICRGMQLMNVFFGGTLHQDTSEFYVEVPRVHTVFPKKRIVLAPFTCLREALGRESCRVNALHRQAIDATGKRIVRVAKEESGLTQAIEHADHDFVLGVQWHPEYLPQLASQRALFRRLVAEARRRAGERSGGG